MAHKASYATDEPLQGLPELPRGSRERAVLVHCRAGFEREAAEGLADQAAVRGIRGTTEARPGLALFTPVSPVAFARIAAALRYADLVFARQLLFSSALCTGLAVGDRVAPLVAAARAQANRYGEIAIETADTEASKPLLRLCRGLASPLRQALRSAGLLGDAPVDPAWPRLHIIFLRSDSARVGLSYPGNSSPWPMGIPRLRAARGAPSRAGRKLEEAFLTLLTAGEREERLRAGMVAVDLGAAPGGWSWQLARRGLSVTAVDNGSLCGEASESRLVRQVRADGFRFRPARPVDWMVCDIVDRPDRVTDLVARWFLEGWCRQCIFNLKLPMKRRLETVWRCREAIGQSLAAARLRHRLTFKHLYHDRIEVTGYITRLS